ncbi:unnamed protein product [Arabidopsis arenosa]|uniref:RRM domain-containing protein n=1 Tax=Arabidopsis arenosa TaxID=38785 RepID=A0A8S2AXX1_ARAAE|nr:unnamed protein product [Arabidopsis arenosa]
MSTKVYVGNLSSTTTDDMRQAFSDYGQVLDGRSRGFGFVTFSSHSEAEAAVSGMNGKVLDCSICGIVVVPIYGLKPIIALVLNFQELDGCKLKVKLSGSDGSDGSGDE